MENLGSDEKKLARQKTNPIKVKTDTYEARKSLGYGHMTDGDMMSKKAHEKESKML